MELSHDKFLVTVAMGIQVLSMNNWKMAAPQKNARNTKRRKKGTSLFQKGNCKWRKTSEQPQTRDKGQEKEQIQPMKTDTQRVKRIEIEIFQSVSTSGNTLPSKLRPKIKKVSCKSAPRLNNFTGNVIVNINNLPLLVNKFCSIHSAHSNECKSPHCVLRSIKYVGLCVSVCLGCQSCNVNITMDLTDKLPKPKNKPGPPPSTLNKALALSVLKTKAGPSDVRYILSLLDIKPPSMTQLQKDLKLLSNETVHINNVSMKKNQEFINEVAKMLNQVTSNSRGLIPVEADCSYNNRCQSGYEAETQAFCPLVEQLTKRKLVLGLSTANKLCRKHQCSHTKCARTYNPTHSMASVEKKLISENITNVESQNVVKISSLTTDACAQLGNIMQTSNPIHCSSHSNMFPLKYVCFVHRMRRVFIIQKLQH
ncbi:uncharacterized protein LOC121367011 [Gigantopelta aegis]|uniref:uncharacterized protein LOC121367011 n=1 Tax=Gigantopelta aegis TaxID=1735272 RepID=UPI001B88CC9B|nr:uncharacterized protein LOC121367011 [Gigantopelta aegis]